MLVFRGIKERDNHETSNQASGIWSAILLERLLLEVGVRPVPRDRSCTGGDCWRRDALLRGGTGDRGSHPDGHAGLHRLVRPASGDTNPTGGTSYQVSGDQFVLSLSGPLGITFTGVTIDTNPVAGPYIFVSPGTTLPGGPPLSTDTFPNTHFTGADPEFATPGFERWTRARPSASLTFPTR